jgi:ankyrin repeat protein
MRAGLRDVWRALFPAAEPVRDASVAPGRFLYYVQEGDMEAVRQALDKEPDLVFEAASNYDTALHVAAERGRLELAKLLLAHKAPVDAIDGQDCTPLHCAALNGHVEMAELLIASGADVNAGDELEWRPLHCAAQNGHLRVAQILLAHHAKVDAGHARDDSTPLHYAAFSGHRNIAQLLVAAGANVNAENTRGETPMAGAARRGHFDLAEFLRRNGGHE